VTTYYVDTAVGNDGNAGTSEGAGNAWATIDKAMNTVAAGDQVWVKASGNYNELATIDTAGGSATPIVFEGYTTTTGDNGRVTIDGQSTRASCINEAIAGNIYYIFSNFVFTGATGDGVDFGTSEDSAAFYNCQFTNNGGHGIQGDNNWLFVNCEFSSNTSKGCDMDNNARFVGCEFFGNGSAPAAASGLFFHCLIHGTASGQSALNLSQYLIQCTVDGNGTSVDIVLNASLGGMNYGNILLDSTADAFGNTTIPNFYNNFIGYNLFYNITGSNYQTTGAANPKIGYGDPSNADPNFTDRAGDDYTLASGSPAIDAGIQPGLL
jgi:hypothetical protein